MKRNNIFEQLFYFFIGLYFIGFGWTLQQLLDKESFLRAIIDSLIWPYFWYNVFIFYF